MRRRITTLLEERASAWEQAKALLDTAAGESRDLTSEEAEQYDRIEAEIAAKGAEVERLERAMDLDSRIRSGAPIHGREPEGVEQDERQLSREDRAKEARKAEQYAEAFVTYLRAGIDGEVPREVRAALQVGTPSEGGYLVPDEFLRVLIESESEFSVIRQLATVIITENNGQVLIPTVATEGAAAKIDEEGTYAGTDPTFGQKVLDSYKYGQIVKISDELAADSAFDVLSVVGRLAGKALGTVTGAAYATGDGSDDPNGVATAASAGVTMASGNTATIDIDALTELQHSVVSAYRSRPGAGYLMKDSTLAFVRKIKTGISGDKTTLWQPSVQAGVPDTLLGKPVYTDPNIDALAASKKVVLFGDFSEYWIRDVGTPEVKVLQERYADTGQIGVRVTQRTDGELADTAAVKALVTSAT